MYSQSLEHHVIIVAYIIPYRTNICPMSGYNTSIKSELRLALQAIIFVIPDFCMCLSVDDPLANMQEKLFVVKDVRVETL